MSMIGRKMISEILAMSASTVPEDTTFTVLAKIDSIFPHCGWFYVTCHRCSKKVSVKNGLFICRICDSPCHLPLIWYRIHLCVGDYTGGTTFTVFNQVAEELLNSSAKKLYKRLGFGRFPTGLIDMVDRFFAFRVRLPDYANEDPDFHTYRVVGLFEIDPLPELKSLWIKPHELDRSKKRTRSGVSPGGSGSRDRALSGDAAESASEVADGAVASTSDKTAGSKKRIGLALSVGVYLPKQVFSHGQLYVAVSRVTNRKGLKILNADNDMEDKSLAKNIVYKEAFLGLAQ